MNFSEIINIIITISITTLFGLFFYLIKFYFSQLQKQIADIDKMIAKIEGGLEPLRASLKENTIQLVQVNSELKAIWRYIDAPKRGNN